MKNLFALFIFAAITFIAAAQPAFIKKDIDKYITTEMKRWNVPGLAVVVVKDGKVAYMKGFGYRDLDKKLPVDENTLFMIASNSKLFTGTAIAMLAQNKKLNLNDRIIKYFPDFKLNNDTTTALVTIKDMLSHRIGTKTFQGDFTFYSSSISRSDIMYKMRYLKPSMNFRESYGYCNSCFLTAGEVIPKVTGISWEQFVQDSIINIAGMKNTYALLKNLDKQPNISKPYTNAFTGNLEAIRYDDWDNLAPAASVISNVNDLSKWLLLQLDSGKVNGKRAISWNAIQATRDINIVTGSRKSSILPQHIRGYGLGLFVADYNGRQIYWHTGGAGGMLSGVCFVPEENLGIAILTNQDNQSLFEALRYQILDAYTGVKYVNRSEQFFDGFLEGEKQQQDSIAKWKSETTDLDIVQARQYSGSYTNEVYGKIDISLKANQFIISFPGHQNLSATLSPTKDGQFLLEYNNIEYGVYKTNFKKDGSKLLLEIKMNPFIEQDSYWFEKE